MSQDKEPLTPERWRQVRELLGEALELEASDRASFLDQHCQHDALLRQEVEALLAECDEPSDFMNTPLLPEVMRVLGPRGPGLDATDAASMGAEAEPGRERDEPGRPVLPVRVSSIVASAEAFGFVGRRIGPYKILGEVGRGGMGVVCLAERADEHFQKRVALKLMRQGLDRTELGRRFKRERQILASLEHPNIAHLLDGGTTDDGLPYFVMEYIDGLPIDRWCQTHQLSVEARLELFLQVCAAVQHAHQHLIVHRDLKPSNILVTQDGVPKLLDFGIAKVLETDPTQAVSELTQTQQRAMTPLYASPEQVQGFPPTTATDVYALGVILYELLCGQRPYELKSFSPVELVRVICEQVPRRVSEQATSPRLARRLRGDLDYILARALRKEPAHRYLSVEQFAEDVRRHLRGLPVLARQGNARYLAAKFVRRNAYLVGGVAAFVGLLLVSLVLLGVQATRVAAQRDAARMERDKAEQVSAFLRGLFEVNAPTEAQGRNITARELLDRGAERIRVELSNQTALQTELMDVIARVYTSLAQYDRAENLLKEALERRTVAGLDTSEASATLWLHLSEVQQARAAYAQAEISIQTAITLLQSEKTGDGEVLLKALAQQARLEQARGAFSQAEQQLRQVLARGLALYGPDRVEVARLQSDLGVSLDQQGRAAEAEQWYRTAQQTLERIGQTRCPEYISVLNNLGGALSFRGAYDEAISMHQQALALRKQVLGETHPSIARSLHNIASVYVAQGRFELARPVAEEELAFKRRLYTDQHPETAKAMDFLVKLRLGQGDLSVEPLARQALALRRQLLGDAHPDTAISMGTLGLVLLDRSDLHADGAAFEEARGLLETALTIQRQKMGPTTSELGATLLGLGRVRIAEGEYAQAEALLREGVYLWESTPLDLTWWLARSRCELARALLLPLQKSPVSDAQPPVKSEEITTLLQQCNQTLPSHLGAHHPYSQQGEALLRQAQIFFKNPQQP